MRTKAFWRDLFLILTVVFAFAALMLFAAGTILAVENLSHGLGAWLHRRSPFWWIGIVDAFLAAAALLFYRQYKRYLDDA